jgi:hypothetical protein
MKDSILLNPDFDLKTFYWFYAKSDSANRPTVVTYTAAFYDTSKEMHTNDSECTPYLLIECTPLTGDVSWTVPEQNEYTVDPRVIEAIKKHFSYSFMFSDGVILTAEYAQDADDENCRLHKHPEFGQAIFGCDLEEVYDNQ